MTNSETNKGRVLVTGCSSGIGLAITLALLAEGWAVTGISRSAPEITDAGFSFVSVDLLDTEETDTALGQLRGFDAVIHAAGLLRVGRHDEMHLEDGQVMWRLHVDTAARLIKHLAPRMPDGGRIVLLGSRVASGVAGRALYAASKAGLVGFARSVAVELAPRRITVNVIAPGATDTPMLSDPARAGTKPVLPPMGQLVQPNEIAALAVFLLSDGAASLTGQQIVVCGGASL